MQTYPLIKMVRDLKCDFERYADYHGHKSPISLWRVIRILGKSPSFFAVMIYRFGYWVNVRYRYKGKGRISKYFFGLLFILFLLARHLSVIFFKVEIWENIEIGPGLFLSNRGNIIIGAKKIGRDCTMLHNVTIGMGIGNADNLPEIGENVRIGSDSIIYGHIKIEDDVSIEDSSVVSRSFPRQSLVGGNPAKILRVNGAGKVHV